MRFLADENFPLDAVHALRTEGFDVVWIRSDAPGMPDVEVLGKASAEGRILITLDKDFGDLAFHVGLPAVSGVMLFRVPKLSALQLAEITVSAVRAVGDAAGLFVVIDPKQIRTRALKSN